MPKTSVYLPAELAVAVKASGESPSALIRRGLAASSSGIPAPSAVQDAGEWMTAQAAAETLGITESRVHHLLDAGWLYGRKDGHRRLLWAESVAAELAARLRRPPYPPLNRYS